MEFYEESGDLTPEFFDEFSKKMTEYYLNQPRSCIRDELKGLSEDCKD